MAQAVVHGTRLGVIADVTSAYTLALVLRQYFPFPVIQTLSLDPITSEAISIAVIGGLISYFLLIVDPINKCIRLMLTRLLTRGNAPKKAWAYQVLSGLALRWGPSIPSERYYLVKARAAFYTPYLGKLRAQISGGAVFSATMLAIIPEVFPKSLPIALLLFFVSAITIISISRDIAWKVPAYCWVVAVYELLVEHKQKSQIEMDELKLITAHLSESNWEEAASWLTYELMSDTRLVKSHIPSPDLSEKHEENRQEHEGTCDKDATSHAN